MTPDPKFKQYDVVYYTPDGIKNYPNMDFSTHPRLFQLNRPYVINSITLNDSEWRIQVDGAAATVPEKYFVKDSVVDDIVSFISQKLKVNEDYLNINSCEPTQYMKGAVASYNDILIYIKQRTPKSPPLYPHSDKEMEQIINKYFDNLSPTEIEILEYELNYSIDVLQKLYPHTIEKLDIVPEIKNITALVKIDSILEMKIKQLINNDYSFRFVEGTVTSTPSDNTKIIYIYRTYSPDSVKKAIEQKWDELYNRAYVEGFARKLEKLTNQ